MTKLSDRARHYVERAASVAKILPTLSRTDGEQALRELDCLWSGLSEAEQVQVDEHRQDELHERFRTLRPHKPLPFELGTLVLAALVAGAGLVSLFMGSREVGGVFLALSLLSLVVSRIIGWVSR